MFSVNTDGLETIFFSITGRGFAGICPTRNSGWTQPVLLRALPKEMRRSKSKRMANVPWGVVVAGDAATCLTVGSLRVHTGAEISALSLPADAPAEAV